MKRSESSDAKGFNKKYGTITAVIQYSAVVLCLAPIVAEYFFGIFDSWIFIVSALLYLVITRATGMWYTSKLESIITKELNPAKLKEIINEGGIFAHMPRRHLLAAYYNGDYQQTVDMCNRGLKNCDIKQSWLFYDYLAGVYFQVGDTQSLLQVCEKFDQIVFINKSVQLYCPLMKLYKLYAKGEYSALQELYDSPEKQKYNKAAYMVCEYIHAVNFYTVGNTEKAKEIFEKISTEAPLLGVGRLAKEQLSQIEQGQEYKINQTSLIPNEEYKLPSSAQRAIKYGMIRNIAVVLIFVTCILVMFILK